MIGKFKQLLDRKQGVHSAATLLMVTMLLSNILGLLRDFILANTTSLTQLDTYYAAFRLPDFLFNLFILGAISSAFIPAYLEVETKNGKEAAWALAQNLLHTALLVLLVLGIGLFIFMPQLLPHFVPGFDAIKLEQTIPLARILLLSPLFFAVSYIVGGMLNAHKKFFAYALAPLLYNLSIIVGGFLSPYFGVTGIAWSVVVGALLHAFIQIPTLLHMGYRHKFVLDFHDKNLRQVIRLMLPRSISLGMSQIVLLSFTRIGSYLPAGAVSIFTLTNNFQTAPIAIFAASMATAVFPFLGQAKSEHDDQKFGILLTNSLKGMFFFIIPSMALFWVFRAYIMRLFLALNHQTWEDTIRAIDTFGWFILALASQGFIIIMVRAFYAKRDTRRPMYISLVGGLTSITLASIAIKFIPDVPALSLAFAMGVIVESLILLIVFRSVYPNQIDLKELWQSIMVAGCFSLIAAVVSRLVLAVLVEGALVNAPGIGTEYVLSLMVALVVGGLTGAVVYLGLALLLHRSELMWIIPKRAVQSVLLPESEEVASPEGL